MSRKLSKGGWLDEVEECVTCESYRPKTRFNGLCALADCMGSRTVSKHYLCKEWWPKRGHEEREKG